jgi:hypothetical protein
MLKMPPGFNSEIVSKRGSGQFRKLDHKNCLKTGVHSRQRKCEGMDFGIGANALE